MDQPKPSVIARWVVAGCIMAGGVFLLARVLATESNWVAAFGKSLFGITALMAGVLLVSPEVVRWALTPINYLLDSVLLPSEEVVPPADLKLARFYGRALRYAEAAEEYARIIRYHPDHAEAYLEGVRAAKLAGDERQARRLYLDARRVLRAQDQRQLLDDLYAARHQPPENLEKTVVEALPEEPLDKPL